MTDKREVLIASYAEGLLDAEDLYGWGVLSFEEAARLRNQPREGLAWLLALVRAK